ncbi:MAG: DUF4124 domain-containing protein [Marinobacter sp.]|nr:DUF4124 domain-containing protein [Marinobacter sp.]
MTFRLVLFAILTAMTSAGYASGVYTWIDEHGVRQFSDTPPETRTYRAIPQENLAPSRYTPNLERPRQQQSATRPQSRQQSATPQRQAGSTANQRRAEQQRRQEQQCERYQARLRSIQAQLRSGYSNAQGNRLREERRQITERYNRECLRN